MNEPTATGRDLRSLYRTTILAVACWTLLIVGSLAWNLGTMREEARSHAKLQAGSTTPLVTPAHDAEDHEFWKISLTHGFIWLLGVGGIAFSARRSRQRILEQQEYRAELQESRLFLENIISSIDDLVVVIDRDYRVVLSNWKGHDFISDAQKQGTPYCYSCFTQREVPCAECHLPQVFATGESRKVESLNPVDGTCREVSAFPYRDQNGAVTLAIEIVRDISERKQSELALQESERKFRNLSECINDWAWEVDENALYTYVSPRSHEMLGYAPAELIGKSIFSLMPADEARRVSAIFAPIVANRESFSLLENTLVHKDGRLIFAETNGSPIYNEEGAFCGYRGVDRDITERKQAEAEIRRLNAELEKRVDDRTTQLASANRELEAFSYSVSHDLRAPLRHIDGYTKMLQEDYAERIGEGGRLYLERIGRAAVRMGELIDDLLELARVSRRDMQRQELDLSTLAREVAANLQKLQPERPVVVEIAAGMTGHGDPTLLRVVLENLLGNAFKYTGRTPEPRVEFGRREERGKRVYFVRDNGAGFDMAYVGKLFKPFQRLHSEQEFAGTGIGLATVERIVQRHGGRVWAEGEVDQGATFFFTLG